MAKSWEAWKNHGINIWKIWKRHHENHAFPCISGDLKTLRKGLPGSHYHTSGWLLEGHTMVASPPMASITTPLLTVCFFTLQQSCGWLGPGWGLNLEVWRFGCTFEVSETRAQTVARFLRSWRSGSFGGEFQASMAVKYSSQKLRTNAVWPESTQQNGQQRLRLGSYRMQYERQDSLGSELDSFSWDFLLGKPSQWFKRSIISWNFNRSRLDRALLAAQS